MDIEPRDLSEVRSVVRGHMVRGIHLTSNLRDEQVHTIDLFIGRYFVIQSSTVL